MDRKLYQLLPYLSYSKVTPQYFQNLILYSRITEVQYVQVIFISL